MEISGKALLYMRGEIERCVQFSGSGFYHSNFHKKYTFDPQNLKSNSYESQT